MTVPSEIDFHQAGLYGVLEALDEAGLDALNFGVIGFDAAGAVQRYNRFEIEASGLERARVVGHHVFEVVAQCMNNFLVATRFEDAAELGEALDETIRYVLTWRMKPSRVELRMLWQPSSVLRYVVLKRI